MLDDTFGENCPRGHYVASRFVLTIQSRLYIILFCGLQNENLN